MPIRKNAAKLSPEERAEFVEAVLLMKQDGNPASGRNYDFYVVWHQASIFETGRLDSNARFWSVSHGVPAFLPWHRAFLFLLEQDLQQVSGNPDLGIPYWDIGAPDADTAIWTDDLMGGTGDPEKDYVVQDGPFAYAKGGWTLNVRNIAVEPDGALRRGLGVNINQSLPSVETVLGVLARPVYDQVPFDGSRANARTFRRMLEGGRVHGIGHNWVGGARPDNSSIGSMRNVWTSPNDPVFFLHHANIDRLWDKWQRQHPEAQVYLPVVQLEGAPSVGFEEANGFGWRNRELINSADLGVEYDGNASDDASDVEEAFVTSRLAVEPTRFEQPVAEYE